MRFKALWLLLLAGCSGPAWISGYSGPVSVFLGSNSEEVNRACAELMGRTGKSYRGCIAIGKEIAIFCQEKDAECLAHEIRHIIEGPFHE